MDSLTRVWPIATELLSRVDVVLDAHGAPADHPVWSQLRRCSATPNDAAAFFATVEPDALRGAASLLRHRSAEYARLAAPVRMSWHGAGGEAYGRLSAALAGYLDGPDEECGMIGQLDATASYLDDVAGWAVESRTAMAVALAQVLGSTQAVAVHSLPVTPGTVTAAADIGCHVLVAAARAVDAGYQVLGRWRGRLDIAPYRMPDVARTARIETTVQVRH